jgi:hypothetical protein
MSTSQAGDVGELETNSLSFQLSVPDQEDITAPFSWIHASDTTLNASIKKALTAWQTNAAIKVNYLPDGTNGIQSDAIVTDVTLAGGLEAMNDFTVKFQVSGATEAYP